MELAGLSSGRGRRLLSIAEGVTDVEFGLVVADDADAAVLSAAEERGIPTAVVESATDALDPIEERGVDLVCLDGWAPGVSGEFLAAAPPTLSATASLDPDADGDPAAAIADGRRITGSTASVLGEEGGILAQDPVAVYGDDDADALGSRLDEATTRALRRGVRLFAAGRVSLDDGVTIDGDDGGRFPARWLATADRDRELRYGENPHQEAALYDHPTVEANVVAAEQLNEGAKALSYNNYNDADAALGLVKEFDRPAAAVIKHTNPAGCATADSVAGAYDDALSTDPQSAFGGIVALNRECDRETADAITESFKEVVVAPSYSEGALSVLCEEDTLRVLDVGALPDPADRPSAVVEKPIAGGRLLQERDDQRLAREDLEVVTEREPTDEQVETMLFAWQAIKHVKSNAIVFATGTETVGVGAGQMSRVDAVRIAAMKAEEHAEGKSAEGAVMASDAFFPFPDAVEAAAEAGVEAVIQPGGSVNDDDVIAAADDLGMTMALTGQRCFRHD
jgi:phosphoribosylaminoimidazolecarboxamide formyltransferase/IMP cyclohydrolase